MPYATCIVSNKPYQMAPHAQINIDVPFFSGLFGGGPLPCARLPVSLLPSYSVGWTCGLRARMQGAQQCGEPPPAGAWRLRASASYCCAWQRAGAVEREPGCCLVPSSSAWPASGCRLVQSQRGA